ncbi:MAG: DUF1569 domain-containing protein [Pirellulales bacterium]|nr:DUF1569 domain-containing protein [Pirellulales bacterium]
MFPCAEGSPGDQADASEHQEVVGRRRVSCGSYDDLLTDLDRSAGGQIELVGNWSLARICKHLAAAFNGRIDGISFRAPWPMRVVGKLLMKKKLLSKEPKKLHGVRISN